ncbi:MAG: hypothetical protein LBL09_03770 [Oscillospiraceae bacterium]|nr:hypothetical protein [Oscillospiraceae bacterium]
MSDKKIGDIYNDVLDFSEGDLRVFILYVDDKPVFRILAGIHNGKWTPRSFGEDANDLDVAIKLLERKNSDLYISGELALDLSGPVPRVAYESTIYKAEEYFEYMQKYFSASRAAFEAYLKEETDYQEGDNINDYIQIGGDGFYGREAPPFTLEPYIEPQSVSYVPIIFGFSIVVAFVIFIILRRRYNAKRS